MIPKPGEYLIFDFGKYRGSSIEEVSLKDPNYLKWCYENIENEYLRTEIENCINID